MSFIRTLFYKSKNKLIDSKKEIKFIFICSLLFLIATWPVLFSHFTTNDDLMVNLLLWGGLTYKESIISTFIMVGRILFLQYGINYFLFTFIKSAILIKGISLLIIFINSTLIFKLLSKFFNINIAYIFLIIFSSTIANGWEHNIVSSYPVAFHLAVFFILSSLIFFYKSILEKNKTKKTIFSFLYTLLYIFALNIYEIFIVYFPIYFLVFIFYKKSILKSILPFIKKSIFIILYLLAYLIFYLVIRNYLLPAETRDGGYNTYDIDPIKTVKTLWIYSTSTIPGRLYDLYSSRNIISSIVNTIDHGKIIFFKEINVGWIVKSILVFFMLVGILINKYNSKNNKNITYIFVSVYLIFAPNILISITSKYIDWALNYGITNFVTSFFSFIGISIFISSIFSIIVEKTPNKMVSILFAILFSSFIAIASFKTDYANYQIGLQQIEVTSRKKLIESFLNSNYFKEIKDEEVIFSPDLFHQINIVAIPESYWNDYVSIKTGKNISILKENVNDIKIDYYIRIIYLDESLYLIATKVNKESNKYNYLTNEISVFGISNSDTINVQAYYSDKTQNSNSMLINGKNLVSTENQMNINENINSLILNTIPLKIVSDSPISVDSIRVYPSSFNYSVGQEMFFGKGCYQKETLNSDYWVWCDKEFEFSILNKEDNSQNINFISDIQSCDKNSFLYINNKKINIGATNKISEEIEIESGMNEFKIKIDGNKNCNVKNDSRNLWIKLENFYVE